MQGGFKYQGSGIKIPTFTPPKPVLSDDEALRKNLETQYANLGKRLEAVGANQIGDNRSFMQKVFNLPEDQNAFLDIIEVIERPMRGIQAGILSAREGDGFGSGFAAGFTGDKRLTGVEFLDEMGWVRKEDLTGAESFLFNVGVDILMDPFTYIAPTKMLGWAFGKGQKGAKSVLGEKFETLVKYFDARGEDFYSKTADEIATAADDLGIEIFKRSDESFKALDIRVSDSNQKVYYRGEAGKGAGATTEYSIPHLLSDYIDAMPGGQNFDDIRFLVEKAENNITDIRMMREVKLANGDVVDIVLDVVESKDFLQGAAGITIALDIIDDQLIAKTLLKGGKKSTKFGTMDKEFQNVFIEAINKLKVKADETGKSISQLVQEAVDIAGEQDKVFGELFRAGTQTDEFFGFFADAFRTKTGKLTQQKFNKFLPKPLREAFQTLPKEARDTILEIFEKYGQKAIGRDEAAKLIDELSGGIVKFADELDVAGNVISQGLEGGLFQNYLKKAKAAKGLTSVTLDSATMLQKLGVSNTKYGDNLGEILKHYFITNSDEYVAFVTKVDGVDTLQMLKKSQVFDFVDTTGRIQYAGSSAKAAETTLKGKAKARQLRLIPEMKLKEGAVLDSTAVIEDFLSKFYVQGTEDIAPGFVIQMLGKLSSDGMPAVVRNLAKATNKAINIIGHSFDWSRGLAKKFVGDLRRAGGEVGFRMQRQAARLDTLLKQVADVPEAETLIRQLMEAGAKIDGNGQVIVEAFNPAMADILSNIKFHTVRGRTAIMETWGKTGADLDLFAKNLQDQLNQIYKGKYNVKDAFEVVVKDGALGVNLKAIDGKTLRKADFTDITEVFTGGGTYKLSDEAKEFFLKNADLVDEYKKLKFEIIDTLNKEALYDVAQGSLQGAPGYFRHSLSDQAKDFLKKQKPAARSRYIQEGVDMLTERTYRGTVDDINKGMRAFYGLDFDFFDTGLRRSFEDLITITARKTEQSKLLNLILKSSDETGQPLFQVINNTAETAEELGYGFVAIKKFDEQFADIYKNMTPEAQAVFTKHLEKIGYDEATSALAIHRSAKTLLDNVNNSFRELPEYIRGFDKFMNMWKSVTLVTPGFHMRNLFGNMANMSFAGMNVAQQGRYATRAMGDFSVYKRTSQLLSEFTGTYDEFLGALSKADATAFTRMVDFFESGVSQSYAGVRDLAGVRKLVEEGNQNLSKRLIGVNFDLAENMDDFQRYMLYSWALDKKTAEFAKDTTLQAWQRTAKAQEAAQQIVAESLFDYKHFTTFEKDVMKRLFPFYTFFKNNLVFQMQTLFKNPGAVGRLGRAYKYASEDLAGVDIESMPDYMTGNMWLPIPGIITKNDTEAISFLKLNLPFSDFTELIDDPFKRGAGSVAAPIKLLFELGAGVDSFTGAPLRAFPGEKDRMDPGSGVLSNLRNQDGDFALSADPIIQKVANDLGLRVPREYLSVVLDVADAVFGEQPTEETLFDALDRFSLTATKEISQIELTQIYQKLEQLRNLQKRYEQRTGTDLPTKADLGIDQTPDWMKPIR